MKKLILSVVAFAMLNLAVQAQTVTAIVWTWTNPAVNATYPTCSSTVTNSCLVGLALADTTNAASPIVITTAIAPNATTYTQTTNITIGTNRTYSMAMGYLDQNGVQQTTTPITYTLNVVAPPTVFAPGGPSGLKGVVSTK